MLQQIDEWFHCCTLPLAVSSQYDKKPIAEIPRAPIQPDTLFLRSEELHSNMSASPGVVGLSEKPPCWAAAPTEMLRGPNIAPRQGCHSFKCEDVHPIGIAVLNL